MSNSMNTPPMIRKATPRKGSRFPCQFDLLRLNHFSPHTGATSKLNNSCTVLDADSVSACWQTDVNDSIELIEVAFGSWSKPHQPSLLCDSECHFAVFGVDMHTYISGPRYVFLGDGNVLAGLVIEFEPLDFIPQLIVHPRDGSAREGRTIIGQWGSRHRWNIVPEGL